MDVAPGVTTTHAMDLNGGISSQPQEATSQSTTAKMSKMLTPASEHVRPEIKDRLDLLVGAVSVLFDPSEQPLS
jgi:hypothetical protein